MNASRAHRLLLRAEVDDGASTTVTHTVELSTAYARIQFDRPLAVGARVGLVLSLPKLLRPVRAEGTIEAHEAPTAPGAFGGVRAALSFGSDGDRAAIASLLARSEAAAAGRGAPLRGLIVDDSLIVR